jgi:hypothetical protein
MLKSPETGGKIVQRVGTFAFTSPVLEWAEPEGIWLFRLTIA